MGLFACAITLYSLVGGAVEAARRAESPTPFQTGEVVCEATGAGKCLYVAVDGDDSNPGSFKSPLKKLQAAVQRAAPGDFVYVRGATYDPSYAANSSTWFTTAGVSGQPNAIITVKAYPGELPILRGHASGSTDSLIQPQVVLNSQYVRLEGFKIEWGNIVVAKDFAQNIHHVWIVNNEVENWAQPQGSAGLVFVQAREEVGPHNPHHIYIWNNRLHGLWEISDDRLRKWEDSRSETERRGCVTIESGTPDGDGLIQITGNELYHCPAIFYFEFHWPGPVVMEGNRIHGAQLVGQWQNSNNEFRNNVVWDIRSGHITGEQSVGNLFEHNTWVGLERPVTSSNPTELVLRKNVVFGKNYLATRGDANEIETDENCFIAVGFFTALLHIGGGRTSVGNVTLLAFRKRYQKDLKSVQISATNPRTVFTDPDNGDFTLIGDAAGACEAQGAQLR